MMPLGGLRKILVRLSGADHQKASEILPRIVGDYRDHIPAFAEVSAPLFNLLKKGKSEQVQWNEAQERVYSLLKEYLLQELVIKLAVVWGIGCFKRHLAGKRLALLTDHLTAKIPE